MCPRDFHDTGRPVTFVQVIALAAAFAAAGGEGRRGILSDPRPAAGHEAVSVRVIEKQPAITLVHRHPPGARDSRSRARQQPGRLAPGLALPLQAGRTRTTAPPASAAEPGQAAPGEHPQRQRRHRRGQPGRPGPRPSTGLAGGKG